MLPILLVQLADYNQLIAAPHLVFVPRKCISLIVWLKHWNALMGIWQFPVSRRALKGSGTSLLLTTQCLFQAVIYLQNTQVN